MIMSVTRVNEFTGKEKMKGYYEKSKEKKKHIRKKKEKRIKDMKEIVTEIFQKRKKKGEYWRNL